MFVADSYRNATGGWDVEARKALERAIEAELQAHPVVGALQRHMSNLLSRAKKYPYIKAYDEWKKLSEILKVGQRTDETPGAD